MKQLFRDFIPVAIIFALWRLSLWGVQIISPKLFTLQTGYLGATPWANFDGIHYLTIARVGYLQYLQAFFPLYPMLIGLISRLTLTDSVLVALLISHIASFFGFYFFYKLSQLYDKKNALWTLIILITYPASLFYAGAYSSSLYLFLATACLYAIEKRHWGLVGLLGALASATWIFGVNLIFVAGMEFMKLERREQKKHFWKLFFMPLGLVMYMGYLWHSVSDPFAFVHQQPLFGANRTGGAFILLPQVLWRYIKIFVTASQTTFIYQVAILEFMSFVLALVLLIASWQKGLKKSYLLYAIITLIMPTLTGTLSSFPRYFQAAFPLFFVMGKLPFAIKYIIIAMFAASLMYFGSAFLKGYFIS